MSKQPLPTAKITQGIKLPNSKTFTQLKAQKLNKSRIKIPQIDSVCAWLQLMPKNQVIPCSGTRMISETLSNPLRESFLGSKGKELFLGWMVDTKQRLEM